MTLSEHSNDTDYEVELAKPPAAADPVEAATATSTAAAGPPRMTTGDRLRLLGSRYALIGVWIVMAGVFAILKSDKFLQTSSAQAIFGSQSALLFLAVAALCTFVVGEFDLSFASTMGLSATIIPVLTSLHNVPIALSCVIAVAVGVGCGAVNAFFVVVLKVPSLIVTLGTASLYLGIAELIGSSTIVSVTDPDFSDIALHNFLGLPLSFWYGLILCAVFAYVLTWTPLGRHIVFVGSNREVARLAGISVDRIRAGSYVVAGLIAGLAGVLLIMTVGGFDPTASATYLLPALAAVFLGTAIVLPGQFNPMGTFLGIYFLETGIFGLQLLGYTGWVQDAFYGAGLVLAVTIATVVRTRSRVA